MNSLYRIFSVLIICVSIGCFPTAGKCDIASPTGYDGISLIVEVAKKTMGYKFSNKVISVISEFPKDLPIVIKAEVNYVGGPEDQRHFNYFEILDAWPGFPTQPEIKLGVKSYNGVVQISGRGTGHRIKYFPGMKILLKPSIQNVSFSGVVHLEAIAEFNAWGKDFKFSLPLNFVKWDADTFTILKVGDSCSGDTGRLIARVDNETFTFYPVQEGNHQIGVTVDGVRAMASVNISPPDLTYLELLPDWGALAGGTFNVIAMAHYENECKPPENVTNQVKWSSQPGPEAKAVKLSVASPSHPFNRVELCEDVSLQAVLTNSPKKKVMIARYENITSSLMVDDPESPSNIDISRHPRLNWSTGTPNFKATFPGNFTITAVDTISGMSASMTLDVVPPASVPLYPLKSISVPGSMTEGETIHCKATLFSCNGASTASNLKWVSMSPDLLNCNSAGDCTAIKSGLAQVAVYSNGQQMAVRSIKIKPQQNVSQPITKANNQNAKKRPLVKFQNSKESDLTRNWRSLSDQKFVQGLYDSILDRSPDKSGYNHWLKLLASGKSRKSCMSWFFKSPEYKSRNKTDADFIIDVYQALYGRNPTNAELSQSLNSLYKAGSKDKFVSQSIPLTSSTASTGKGLPCPKNTKRCNHLFMKGSLNLTKSELSELDACRKRSEKIKACKKALKNN